MALKLTSKGAVRLSWENESMEAIWTLNPTDTEAELLSKMTLIVRFVREQQDVPELPERTPGLALEMAQMTHPAPAVINGWVVQPEIPERLANEVEMIPPEEQE